MQHLVLYTVCYAIFTSLHVPAGVRPQFMYLQYNMYLRIMVAHTYYDPWDSPAAKMEEVHLKQGAGY